MVVPDDVGDLRPRQAAHLDLEPELAPFLRDQLRGLEFLRVGGLRPRDQHQFANFVAGGVGRNRKSCTERKTEHGASKQ